jgi:hypothetical protein
MKLWLSAILLSASVQSFSQDLTQKIDFQYAGGYAKKAIEALAKQTQVPLVSSPSMQYEPLIISVKGVTIQELMDRIAQATEGKWVRDSEGIRLISNAPPPSPQADFNKRVERIKSMQKKAREEVAKAKPFDHSRATALLRSIEEHLRVLEEQTGPERYDSRGEQIGSDGPARMLALRIFADLDPTKLAQVRRNNRLVFSSRPTRLQSPLPSGVWPHVRQYQSEIAIWKSTIGTRTFKWPERQGVPTHIYQLIQGNFEWDEPTNPGGEEATRLLVACESYSDGLDQISIRFVDSKGKYVGEATSSMYELERADMQPEDGEGTSLGAMLGKANDEPPIELSAASTELMKTLRGSFDGNADPAQQRKGVPAEFEKYFLQPELYDLSELILPECFFAVTNTLKLNVVACPSDFMVSLAAMAMGEQGKATPSQFVRLLGQKMFGTRLTKENGWLVLGAKHDSRWVPMGTRFNRPAVGQFLRNVKAAGRVTIDAAAEYTMTRPADVEPYSSADFILLSLYLGDESEILMQNPNYLRLYGSMTPAQRQSIKGGIPIRFANLTAYQKGLLERMVYGGNRWDLQFSSPQDAKSDEEFDYNLFYNGVLSEPTERFANGLPPTGEVKITITEGPVVTAYGMQGQYPTSGTMSAEEFGNYLHQLEVPQEESGWERPVYTSFEYKQQKAYHIHVTLDKFTSMQSQLNEKFGASKRVNSFDLLPDSFKKQALEARDKAKKRWEEWRKQGTDPGNDPGTP